VLLGLDGGYAPWPSYDVLQGGAVFTYGSAGYVATGFQSDLLYADSACTGAPVLSLNFDDTEGAPSFVSTQSRVVQRINGVYHAWRATGAYAENVPTTGGRWWLTTLGACQSRTNLPDSLDEYVVVGASAPISATWPLSIVQQ
jgi:hypothetical protein